MAEAEPESTPSVEVEIEVQVCDSCGTPYDYIWFAPHPIWNGLVDRHGAGKRCIACFDRLLQGAGMLGRWTFELIDGGQKRLSNEDGPPQIEQRSCSQSVAGVTHDKHIWHSGSTDAEYFWCAGFAWKPLDRDELVSICEAAVVPESKWVDRDSPEAQEQLGKCWVFLRAGCPFNILTIGDGPNDRCVTDDETIWLKVNHSNFSTFDSDGAREWEVFYLPTRKRLLERAGRDWY